jgi:hypothetical protein
MDDETGAIVPEDPPISKEKPKKTRRTKKAVSKENVKMPRTKARRGKNHAAKAKRKNGPRGPRLQVDPNAKVMKTGEENPYREGSDAYKRVEQVLKYSGQTVKTVKGKSGLKPTTISTMVKLGLIRLAG